MHSHDRWRTVLAVASGDAEIKQYCVGGRHRGRNHVPKKEENEKGKR